MTPTPGEAQPGRAPVGPGTPGKLPSGDRLMAGVLALTVMAAYGVLMYAFPAVLTDMQAELGWSRSLLTGAYAASSLVGGVVAVPVGRWIDRHGTVIVMTTSAAVAPVLVAAWSQVRSPVTLYLVWAGLGACSAGLFYEAAFAAIIRRSRGRRAQAIIAVTVVGGLAGPIFVPLTAWLAAWLGWRVAVLWLAGLLACTGTLPHALLLRRRRDPQSLVDDSDGATPVPIREASRPLKPEAVPRTTSLQWFVAAFAVSGFASAALVVHLIPILLERGHALPVASLALGSIGVAKLAGRALLIPLARRARPGCATALVLVLQGLGLLVLMASPSGAGIGACVLLFGVADGAATPVRAEVVASLCGSSNYATISGVIASIMTGARALAPVGISLLHDATGGYGTPLLALVVTLLAVGAAVRRADRAPTTRSVSLPACVLFSVRPSTRRMNVQPPSTESVL